MSTFRPAADRAIGAALADADNALSEAQGRIPDDLEGHWQEYAIDGLACTSRALLLALSEIVSELRAGPPGPAPDELAAAEGGVINAAYHLALCTPADEPELLQRLIVQVRRHHGAVSALAAQGGGR